MQRTRQKERSGEQLTRWCREPAMKVPKGDLLTGDVRAPHGASVCGYHRCGQTHFAPSSALPDQVSGEKEAGSRRPKSDNNTSPTLSKTMPSQQFRRREAVLCAHSQYGSGVFANGRQPFSTGSSVTSPLEGLAGRVHGANRTTPVKPSRRLTLASALLVPPRLRDRGKIEIVARK